MSDWSDRVAQSHFVPDLTLARSILDTLDDSFDSGSEEREKIERMKYAIDHFSFRFASADPNLISEQTITPIEQYSERLLSEIQQLDETKNSDFLDRAMEHLQQLISHGSQLPIAAWGTSEEVVQSAAQSFNQKALELSSRIKNASDILQENVTETGQQLDSLESKINETSADFQSKADGFTQQVQDQVRRLDAVISSENDQFASTGQERSQQFDLAQDERSSEFQRVLDEHRVTSNDLIDYLQSKKEEAAHIIGSTAASMTAGAYLQDAKDQRRQADIWRGIAFASFAGAVSIGYVTLIWFAPEQGTPLSSMVFFYFSRFLLALAISGLGGYAIRESSQHRLRERTSKRLADELTTFQPFLEELDENERHEEIKAASPKYFRGHATIHLHADE